MKLLLAEHHALFRDAMIDYIERIEPQASVRTVTDFHKLAEVFAARPEADLALLDLRMPGLNGFQGLETLRRQWPEIPVAVLCGPSAKKDVEMAMVLGAAGYFPRVLSGKVLLNGIRQILDGAGFFVSGHEGGKAAAAPVAASLSVPSQACLKLTPREKQVLDFLLRGDTNKDIARALDLQVVTVKLHVRGVCRKLGAKNRTHAAMLAREYQL